MKNKDSINLNFERIEAKVTQNIQSAVEQTPVVVQPRPKFKRIAILATCALLLCALSVGSTLGITQYVYAAEETIYVVVGPQDNSEEVNTETPTNSSAMLIDYRNTDIVNGDKFDRFVSYGRACCYEILRSRLIKESDKDIFNHAAQHVKNVTHFTPTCCIYLGEKDGVDYVFFVLDPTLAICDGIYECAQCADAFSRMYESNLGYSLNSVICAFENLIGQELTKEILNAPAPTERFRYDSVGLNIALTQNDNWTGRGKGLDKYQYWYERATYLLAGDFTNAKISEVTDGSHSDRIINGCLLKWYEITQEGKRGSCYILTDDPESIVVDENGVSCSTFKYRMEVYNEYFYLLFNNQIYLLNRAYLLEGVMCPQK